MSLSISCPFGVNRLSNWKGNFIPKLIRITSHDCFSVQGCHLLWYFSVLVMLLWGGTTVLQFADHVGDILDGRIYFTIFDAGLNGSRHVLRTKPVGRPYEFKINTCSKKPTVFRSGWRYWACLRNSLTHSTIPTCKIRTSTDTGCSSSIVTQCGIVSGGSRISRCGGGANPIGGWGPQCPMLALFGENVCKNKRIGSRCDGGGMRQASPPGIPWIRQW